MTRKKGSPAKVFKAKLRTLTPGDRAEVERFQSCLQQGWNRDSFVAHYPEHAEQWPNEQTKGEQGDRNG